MKIEILVDYLLSIKRELLHSFFLAIYRGIISSCIKCVNLMQLYNRFWLAACVKHTSCDHMLLYHINCSAIMVPKLHIMQYRYCSLIKLLLTFRQHQGSQEFPLWRIMSLEVSTATYLAPRSRWNCLAISWDISISPPQSLLITSVNLITKNVHLY